MDELSTQQILDLLMECAELGAKNFHIFGGEPFLREDLAEIVSYAYDLNYQLSIATNGTQIHQADFTWLQRTDPFLGISLHGPPDFHDSFCRGQGAYPQALTTLHKALDLKLNVGVITCVTQLNYPSYFSWMQSLIKHRVQTFFVLYFSPLGRGKRKDLQVTNAQWRQLYHNLQDYVLNSTHSINIYFETSIFPKTPYYFYQTPMLPSCSLFTKSNCVVDANGDVYPCILFLRNSAYKLGNFKLNSLYEIWDRFQSHSSSPPKRCQNCNFLSFCKGGCPAYSLTNEADFRCDGKFIPCCPLYTELLG